MTKSVKRFAANKQRDFTKSKVLKLQRAGLLGDVDFSKPLPRSVVNRISKYNALITGKATAVKAPDAKTAAHLRKTLGLKGSGRTIVVPKEKGERFRYQKSTGEVISERKGFEPGERIRKTLAPKNITPEPGSGKRLYYTIPERTRGAGKLKRKTFSTFNEFLHYIHAYDIRFEDIEDRLEIEEIVEGGRKDKRLQKTISEERAAASARYARKRKRNAPKKRKPAKKHKAAKKTAKKPTKRGKR